MGRSVKPIYLDTNAIVQLIERRDAALRSFMIRVNAAGRRFVTSELTLAELLVKPIEWGDNELCETYEELLSDVGLVRAYPVDRAILRQSAALRASLGGNLPDTVHLATAVALGCDSIISSDRRMKLPQGLIRISTDDLLADPAP
jgi:predicted nucleic acid-binding protein